MVNLRITYLVEHLSTRWLRVVSTPVFVEEEASIEYLRPWSVHSCSMVICSVASVCLSVCPVRVLTFESLDRETCFFCVQVHLQNYSVKFGYQSRVLTSSSHEQKTMMDRL